jgi:hypothetical protein
VTAS